MHPANCPEWEYEAHPRRGELRTQATTTLIDLRRGALDTRALAADSRAVHERLFRVLVPAGYDYYAGHYRGEDFRCLRFYRVTIPGDPRVGSPPGIVGYEMAAIAQMVLGGLHALDIANRLPEGQLPRYEKLLYAVIFACRVFEIVLRVHPYANGNGHAARFIVWAILGRYGFWPRTWPLDPRPPDPPYSQLIGDYRSGNRQPLEEFVLKAVTG